MKKFVIILCSLVWLVGCIPKPEITIQGVEDGEVYIKDRTISINEELAGKDYELKLNDENINNEHTVSENGQYHLKVKAKKWWQEKEKSIHFKIDDRPPQTPELEEEIKSSYYQSVTFGLDREEGVSYNIKLDGKPHDIDKPIKEEGEHVLSIIAKKENQLVSQRKFNFTVDNRTYTRQEVDFLLDFSLNLPDEKSMLPRILKWEDNVDIIVQGNPTPQDWNALESYISNLNDLLPIFFTLHEPGDPTHYRGKINMHFVPNYKFDELGFEESLYQGNYQVVGFAYPKEVSPNGAFKETTIGIGTNTPQSHRNTTIYHELIHALGLYSHFENRKSSILYPYDHTGVTQLNEMDKKVIELLYRPDIAPGMYRPQVESILQPRITDESS